MSEKTSFQTRRWFYSYVWETPSSGLRYEHQVTDRHPLYEVADWLNFENGNNRSRLIFYRELTADELDPTLTKYVDFALAENYGELGTLPDDDSSGQEAGAK